MPDFQVNTEQVEENFVTVNGGPDDATFGTLNKVNIPELREGTGHIRVGHDFQAELPVFIPPNQRTDEQCAEGGLLVWAPSDDLEGQFDYKLEQFIRIAKGTYGYNKEQALGLLFWHRYDMDRAIQDLANFTPFPNNWSEEDKVLFEQAYQIHGKSFQRIRQMMPDKSRADLIQHYYSQPRSSIMNRQGKKLTVQEGHISSLMIES